MDPAISRFPKFAFTNATCTATLRRTELDPVVRRLPPAQRPAWADPPALRWFDEWDLSMLDGEPILA
jgi:hypothetical protein